MRNYFNYELCIDWVNFQMQEKYQKYFKQEFPSSECALHKAPVSLIATDDHALLCTKCIKDYRGRPLQDLQEYLSNMTLKMRSQHLSINQRAQVLASAARFEELIQGVNQYIARARQEEEKKRSESEPLIDESQTLLRIYSESYQDGNVKALANVEKQTAKLAKEMGERHHKVGKIRTLKDYLAANYTREKAMEFLVNAIEFLSYKTKTLEAQLKEKEAPPKAAPSVQAQDDQVEPPRFSVSKALGREFDFVFRKMRKVIEKKSFGPSCCRLEAGVPLGKTAVYKFYIQHVAPGQVDIGFTTLSHFEKVSCFLNYIYCIRHDSVFCNSKVISEAKVKSGDVVALRVRQDHTFRADIELFLNNVMVCSGLHFQFGEQLIPAVMLRNQGDIVEILD